MERKIRFVSFNDLIDYYNVQWKLRQFKVLKQKGENGAGEFQ